MQDKRPGNRILDTEPIDQTALMARQGDTKHTLLFKCQTEFFFIDFFFFK